MQVKQRLTLPEDKIGACSHCPSIDEDHLAGAIPRHQEPPISRLSLLMKSDAGTAIAESPTNPFAESPPPLERASVAIQCSTAINRTRIEGKHLLSLPTPKAQNVQYQPLRVLHGNPSSELFHFQPAALWYLHR